MVGARTQACGEGSRKRQSCSRSGMETVKSLSFACSISSLQRLHLQEPAVPPGITWGKEALENRFLLIEWEEQQGLGSRANRPRNCKTQWRGLICRNHRKQACTLLGCVIIRQVCARRISILLFFAWPGQKEWQSAHALQNTDVQPNLRFSSSRGARWKRQSNFSPKGNRSFVKLKIKSLFVLLVYFIHQQFLEFVNRGLFD